VDELVIKIHISPLNLTNDYEGQARDHLTLPRNGDAFAILPSFIPTHTSVFHPPQYGLDGNVLPPQTVKRGRVTVCAMTSLA